MVKGLLVYVCLYVCLSVILCAYLFTCPSVCIIKERYTIYLPVSSRVPVCISLLIHVCTSVYVCLDSTCAYLPVYLCVCLEACRFSYLSLYVGLCVSVCQSDYLSVASH